MNFADIFSGGAPDLTALAASAGKAAGEAAAPAIKEAATPAAAAAGAAAAQAAGPVIREVAPAAGQAAGSAAVSSFGFNAIPGGAGGVAAGAVGLGALALGALWWSQHHKGRG